MLAEIFESRPLHMNSQKNRNKHVQDHFHTLFYIIQHNVMQSSIFMSIMQKKMFKPTTLITFGEN